MKPKNAETTERFGPKPNFSTQYGYAAPITTATTRPTRMDRTVSSGATGGGAGWRDAGGGGAVSV